jgi:sugar/nucleoside kinase (ribokinase family)
MPGGRPPRIAAIGMASWDTLIVVERYPPPGTYAEVLATVAAPGGTTTNTAAALARLGATVALRAVVGDDAAGHALQKEMASIGVDIGGVMTHPTLSTDASTILVSTVPPDRTILWHRGALLVKGDRLDIEHLFGHDLVILDVADMPLLRFLTDLPAHTRPDARLLGTMTYLVEPGTPDALDIALRFDTLVGNQRQFRLLTGSVSDDAALDVVRARMPGANLRTAIQTRGADGCRIITRDEAWTVPAFATTVVDPTGAGDAFAAGVAWGMAQHWPWPATGRFANALGALATRALGAQAGQPSLAEVEAMLAVQ